MGKINGVIFIGIGLLFLLGVYSLWGSLKDAFSDSPFLIVGPVAWIILGILALVKSQPEDPWFGNRKL